jgi:hypothetical protein
MALSQPLATCSERWKFRNVAWGEEYRERAQGGIGHGIQRLDARARIREALDDRAQVLDQAGESVWARFESKRQAHRPLEFACAFLWSYAARLRKCSDLSDLETLAMSKYSYISKELRAEYSDLV